eukprot:3343685-Prymnesium_polylepis.1
MSCATPSRPRSPVHPAALRPARARACAAPRRAQNWYYSYAPVPGTSFMLAITVREDLVTGKADDAIDGMRGNVNAAIIINVLLCGLVLVLLVCCTSHLNVKFARPVNKLRELSRGWAQGNFSEDIDPCAPPPATSRAARPCLAATRATSCLDLWPPPTPSSACVRPAAPWSPQCRRTSSRRLCPTSRSC